MMIAIPPNAERLNALMRPAEGVSRAAVAHGILREIGDLDDGQRVRALAYVFDVCHYARYSGPETRAAEYPEPFSDDAIAEALTATLQRDPKFNARVKAFLATLAADEPGTGEAAQRVWKFLGSITAPPMRALLLSVLLDDGPCVERAVTPEEVPYRTSDNEAFHRTLWKHRETLKRIAGAFETSDVPTMTGEGAIVFDLVHAIEDPRERAAVLGWALHQHCEQISGHSASFFTMLIDAAS